MDKNNWKEVRAQLWKEYADKERKDFRRTMEIQNHKIHLGDNPFDGLPLKFGMSVIGEPDENGYPLYIAMHGGGQDPEGFINEQQWEHMGIYYRGSVKHGIYVNVRAVRDTWDCHGNPESFPLYDRLIEDMILFYNADPNRVYFLGFSAGGDGVYICSPRMADRLAATHMSAGHHNGTSVWNLRNTPIQMQVGQKDTAYNRHKVTVEYQVKLDDMQKKYGGYVHNCFVHIDKPHNFCDEHGDELQSVIADNYKWLADDTVTEKKADTDAIHFLDQFTRNPVPERIVWDLGNRAPMRSVTSFYWLDAPMSVNEGFLVADIDKERNAIVIGEDSTVKNFSVLLNDDMLDLDKPVKVIAGDKELTFEVTRCDALLKTTLMSRGDINYGYTAKVDVDL